MQYSDAKIIYNTLFLTKHFFTDGRITKSAKNLKHERMYTPCTIHGNSIYVKLYVHGGRPL